MKRRIERFLLVTVLLLSLAASSCYVSSGYVGYGYSNYGYNGYGYGYDDVFYSSPMDQYDDYGFYGYP